MYRLVQYISAVEIAYKGSCIKGTVLLRSFSSF